MKQDEGAIPILDFLSLDTQGSELEIMQGANQTINKNVIAIQTKASFSSVYENQPLFGDIELHLRQIGFEIASIDILNGIYISNRTPIGLSGSHFPR